jgi:hypothetical protein
MAVDHRLDLVFGGAGAGLEEVLYDLLEVRIITSAEFELPAPAPDVLVPIYAHFEQIWVKWRNV